MDLTTCAYVDDELLGMIKVDLFPQPPSELVSSVYEYNSVIQAFDYDKSVTIKVTSFILTD